MRIDLTRAPDECCDTYHATAREIAKIPQAVGSEEWINLAMRKIKRYGHHEKLSVYQRVKFWFAHPKAGPENKVALETVEIKIRTHEDFASRSDEEIM